MSTLLTQIGADCSRRYWVVSCASHRSLGFVPLHVTRTIPEHIPPLTSETLRSPDFHELLMRGESEQNQTGAWWYFDERASSAGKIQRSYREIVGWKHTSHQNVLPFLGISETLFPFCIISPWSSNGNIIEDTRKNQRANRLLLVSDPHGLKYSTSISSSLATSGLPSLLVLPCIPCEPLVIASTGENNVYRSRRQSGTYTQVIMMRVGEQPTGICGDAGWSRWPC